MNGDASGMSAPGNITLIERYLASLATRRKLSAHTVSNYGRDLQQLADRKSTRLNSSHIQKSRMPSSA